ncbi:MAG: hypothetical protein IT430_09065 [Phycisphaerales bacterium]|nr:hypothetical protein [Phycisphaerales bacterium]
MAQYVITCSQGGVYRFLFFDGAGDLLLLGEPCEALEDAQHCVALCRANAQISCQYGRESSSPWCWYFTLSSRTRGVLATSSAYAVEADRDEAMLRCRQLAPTAPALARMLVAAAEAPVSGVKSRPRLVASPQPAALALSPRL